jgi:hypothetical protein
MVFCTYAMSLFSLLSQALSHFVKYLAKYEIVLKRSGRAMRAAYMSFIMTRAALV